RVELHGEPPFAARVPGDPLFRKAVGKPVVTVREAAMDMPASPPVWWLAIEGVGLLLGGSPSVTPGATREPQRAPGGELCAECQERTGLPSQRPWSSAASTTRRNGLLMST